MTTSNYIAIVCAAILGTLVFALGANVTRMRAVTGKQGGDQQPTDPASPLLIAIRAHGNAIEYIPTLLVLFLLASQHSPAWLAIPLIIGATLGRLLHAFGMLTTQSLAEPTIIREAGAGVTYLFGIGLALATAFSLL